VKKVLTPLIKHGTRASTPEAFDTMALSTIDIAGARVLKY
jgi:hypothetical protein